jgi:PTS system mannose-specific IIA component
MIGILLITHGTFGESLIQNVCQVLNKRPPLIGQLGVTAQDDPLDMLPLARLRLAEVDEGDGVLIMTDMLGATPSNLGLKLLVPGRVEGVAGVSLPMLLRVLTYRKSSMEIVLLKAISGGRDGVICMPLP